MRLTNKKGGESLAKFLKIILGIILFGILLFAVFYLANVLTGEF
jgi:hypothetical protein